MTNLLAGLPEILRDKPVLIAGPTASGKSALALAIARKFGGVIVNADASQVYNCWRVITARPSKEDEAEVPHHLYGHVNWNKTYSTGHWLREVATLLQGDQRLIIVGGTGLYFQALTKGLTDIPAIPDDLRRLGDSLSLNTLLQQIDSRTASQIDVANRARVQRAWEVLKATGRGMAQWQAQTPPPPLELRDAVPLVFDVPKDWLETRIARRFDQMLEHGALDECRAMMRHYDQKLPAFKAIGVPEILANLRGEITLGQAQTQVQIATRQFAKRQRTWFRSKMKDWHQVSPAP